MTRTLFGILFVVVLVAGTLYSPLSFGVLYAFIAALAVWEFGTLVNSYADVTINRFISTGSAVYLFFAFFAYCTETVSSAVFIPYLLSLIYLLVSELYEQRPNPLGNWAYAFASQIYIALPFALVNVLSFRTNAFDGTVSFAPLYTLAVFIFLWVNDSGAYLCGSMLHKYVPYKLFPRVSPNKSWIGSIGGGVLVLVAAAIVAHFIPLLSLWQWMGLGLTVCIFGTWGDLVESLLKRQFGIKDSGNFLPGHGGLLDRFDSSLLALPAATIYLYSLTLFG